MRSSLLPWLVGCLTVLGACAQSEDSNLGFGTGGTGNAGNGGTAGAGNASNGGTAGNGGSDTNGGSGNTGNGGSGNTGNGGAGGTTGGVGGNGAAGSGTGGAGNAGSGTGGAGNAGSGAGGAGNAGSGTGGAGNAGSGAGGAGNAGSGGTGAGGTGAGGSGGTTGCTPITATPIYALDLSTNYIYFSPGPNLGGAEQDFLFVEFYSGASGTFDLTTGGNDNYETCNQCLRVLEDISVSTTARVYFQTAGSITVSGSLAGGSPQITLNNVVLSEVTIDPNSYHSTLVPGGNCYSISTPTTATAISTPPPGSCNGFCDYVDGSFPAYDCFCDIDCLSFGDCCSDYTAVCP